MISVSDHFLNILDSSQPNSLQTLHYYELDETNSHQIVNLNQIADAWIQANPECTWQKLNIYNTHYSFSSKVDLVLISDTLENLSLSEGKTLLGQIRNFGVLRIAVLIDDHSAWSFADFISLGFHRQRHFPSQDGQTRAYTLYTYNLDTYNHKRTWNNSRFWANPEMWNKSRW